MAKLKGEQLPPPPLLLLRRKIHASKVVPRRGVWSRVATEGGSSGNKKINPMEAGANFRIVTKW